jgi:signal transduction histidine kinase
MDDAPERILLVEDNRDYALLVRRLLTRQQLGRFTLEHVGSLDAALEWLQQGPPAALLLDLSLPDSHGLETFDRINRAAPTVPVVVLTSSDDDAVALEAVRRGAQDFLVKPRVDGPILARSLRYAIERKRAQEAMRARNTDLERHVAERTTELRAANEALAAANAELRELDRMKSAFIDVTSHEMRTPVLTIRGMLHVARRRIPNDDEQLVQAIEAAIRGARRLDKIIARVLDVAHSGEFVRRVERCAVPPVALVDDAVRALDPIVLLRGQTLTTDVPEDLAPVVVARERILDVLLNLLLNAVKFTPDGGTIDISVRQDERATTFAVHDNGVGIPDADRPHVFEPFFTTFDALHHSSGEFGFLKRGIGLGLAIVRNFVERHGGTVGVESALGQGSTFWFTLPRNGA